MADPLTFALALLGLTGAPVGQDAGAEDAVPICEAAADPEAYAGREISGEAYWVNADPHGYYLAPVDCAETFVAMLSRGSDDPDFMRHIMRLPGIGRSFKSMVAGTAVVIDTSEGRTVLGVKLAQIGPLQPLACSVLRFEDQPNCSDLGDPPLEEPWDHP